MTQKVWSVRLVLMCCAALSSAEMETVCRGDNVLLHCNGGKNIPYLEVAWYKANKGLWRVIIRTNSTFVSRRSPPASFVEEHGLLLPRAAPEDAGMYECAVTAKIGHKNHNHRVDLSVEVCPTSAPSTLCSTPTPKLPTMWTIIGYLVVGATKTAVSLICILVCRAIYARHTRRRRRKGSSSR